MTNESYELPAEPPVGSTVVTPAGHRWTREDGSDWRCDDYGSRPQYASWKSLLVYDLRMDDPDGTVVKVPDEPPIGTRVRTNGVVYSAVAWTGNDQRWTPDPDGMHWQWFSLLAEFGPVEQLRD